MIYSPFIHKLATNYAPTNDEIRQISQLLVEPLDQLHELDVEISRLQQSMEELSAKRQQLNKFIIPHQALLSPIRRIPQEILQEVFLRCLPTNYNSVMSCQEAPLLLGRVCSSWRNVSMAMPTLWSSIYISVPEPTTLAREGVDIFVLTQAVTEWLDRSGVLPLSITLFHKAARMEEHALVQYLVSLCNRWKHIDLSLSTFTYTLIAPLLKEDVPLLESCSLRTPTVGFSATRDISSVNLSEVFQASRLRRLLLPSPMVPRNASNWSALTEIIIMQGTAFILNGLRIDLALDVLRQCKNLVVCTLAVSETNVSFSGNTTVVLPNLKYLAIRGGHGVGGFLERLELPMLHSLEISVDSLRTEPGTSPLHTFFNRITSLESITLSCSYGTQGTLTELVAHLPDMTELFINITGGWSSSGNHNAPFDDNVLTFMVATKEKPLFPRLKVIKCHPTSISSDTLLNFIRSRTIFSSAFGVARLDHISFQLPEKAEDIFPELSEVIAGGTEVVVTYQEKSRVPRRVFDPRGDLDRPVPRLDRLGHLEQY